MSATVQNSRLSLLLDLVERIALAGLFGYFVYDIATDFVATRSLASLLLLVSEGMVVVFVLIRRRTTDISLRPQDWLLAFLGTTLPLLARPGGDALGPAGALIAIMLVGMILQIAAKLFLRRSFGIVAANRGVRIGGPYRLMRHPMYAGYILTQFGFLIINPTMWNLAIYVASWAMQYGRIIAEERILMRDDQYRDFAERVPHRLIPGVF